MLTSKQMSAFWQLWAHALSEDMPGADQSQRETYRRTVLFRATGKISLKDITPTGDYDKLMYAVASIAGDYQAMGYWCNAKERRTAFMIGECARQIGEITGHPRGWEYCRGVFSHAQLPPNWMDIPDGLLTSVFQMLDTHRRRLLRRDHGWLGERVGQPLGFQPTRIYVLSHNAVDYYDPVAPGAASTG